MSLFVTKPLAQIRREAQAGEATLKRTLGPGSLVALGIGAIIGAGLFALTGLAAAQNAGPAVILSFVVAAIGCAFAGLCYSEFATMIPIAGSAYTYAYATMGELIAWIIGWDLVLEYAVGAATVSVSWSTHVVGFFRSLGITVPAALTSSPFEGGIVNLPAILIVCALSGLLIVGVQESARANAVIVCIKISVVMVFILTGVWYINRANYHPFIIPNTGVFGEFGFSGILRAAGVIFFAYIGFDAVSTAAQEAKNPQRDMPIGIIGSLVIATLLYVGFSYVLTGLVPYNHPGNVNPLAINEPTPYAIGLTPHTWLKPFIEIAIIAGYTSVILVMLLGQSRVFYSMSHDGLLPKCFCDVHPKFCTPWRSNLLFAVFVSMFAGFLPISDLGHMTSIGTLLAFTIVCVGIVIMRRTHPEAPRPFKTPLVPLVPGLGALICLIMMRALPVATWWRLGIWLVIGLGIYFGYSRRHSHLANGRVVPEGALPEPAGD